MQKRIVIAAFMAFVSNFLWAQKDVKKQGPEVRFLKTLNDFGKISEDIQYAKCRFQFINTGTLPLQITNVQTSCGCTTPEWTRDSVAPGDTGFVEAKYETINRIGSFRKTITVYSNAENASFVQLEIVGDVYRPEAAADAVAIPDYGKLSFNKPTLEFSPLYDTKQDTQVVRLTNGTVFSAEFTFPTDLPPFCRILDYPKSLEPNETAKVTIIMDGTKISRYGFGAFEIPFISTNPVMPAIGLYVAYNSKQYFPKMSAKELSKQAHLKIDKSLHDFGSHISGDVLETEFTFTNDGKKDLVLHEIYPECTCVRVTYAKNVLKPGESMKVKAIFDTVSRRGMSNQSIWIVSNDPTKSEQYIYLRARLPEKDYHCPTCR